MVSAMLWVKQKVLLLILKKTTQILAKVQIACSLGISDKKMMRNYLKRKQLLKK